jgi:hypothetical protein
MVKIQSKKPSIQTIFEKDQDGLFTKDALFYQDILSYPFRTGQRKFKLREIGIWLLKHNLKLIQDYEVPKNHTPFGIRYENRKKYFEIRIKELTEIGLLSRNTTKAAKVETQISLYSLTGDGYFVNWLLERIKARNDANELERKKARVAANEKLYDFIQVNFKQYDSYQIAFLSREFEIYKDKGWLDIVFNIIEELLERDHNIISKGLHKLSLQTLNSLDEQHKISESLYIKSALEGVILDQLPPREWEYLRLNHLNEYSTVILYGKCHHCDWSDYVEVDPLGFINVHIENKIHSICPKCKQSDLHISTELPLRPLWKIIPG